MRVNYDGYVANVERKTLMDWKIYIAKKIS